MLPLQSVAPSSCKEVNCDQSWEPLRNPFGTPHAHVAGTEGYGGDCRAQKEHLKEVTQIQASRDTFGASFAAVRADGRVVTWGVADAGGDSSAVQEQLRQVQRIQATRFGGSYAAIRADGTVVTWGNRASGGDSSGVQAQLYEVEHIQATESAFAAIRKDGCVVTWGNPHDGGDSTEVQDQLMDVTHVQATSHAFAAIRADGSVVTWGSESCGGDSSEVQEDLELFSNGCLYLLFFVCLSLLHARATWWVGLVRGPRNLFTKHQLKVAIDTWGVAKVKSEVSFSVVLPPGATSDCNLIRLPRDLLHDALCGWKHPHPNPRISSMV